MKHTHKYGFWYGFNITAVLLIPFFLFLVPILHAYQEFAQSVDLHLEQTGTAIVQQEIALSITMDNENATPLNAIEFEILSTHHT